MAFAVDFRCGGGYTNYTMGHMGWNIFITMIMLIFFGFMAFYYFTIRIPTYATGELCLEKTRGTECMYFDCAKEDAGDDLYSRICGFFGGTGWYDTSRKPVYKQKIDFRDNTNFPPK